MTTKKVTTKGSTKGKAEGSEGRRVEEEAEATKQKAHALGAGLYGMAVEAVFAAPEALAVARRCRDIYDAAGATPRTTSSNTLTP